MIVVDTDVLIEMLEKNRNEVSPRIRNWNRAEKIWQLLQSHITN